MQSTPSPDKRSPDKNDIQNRVARGAVWVGALNLGMRSLSFFSVLILSRLLSPDDFGVTALAAVVIGLIDAGTQFGLGPSVVHRKDPTRDFYDTVWTLQILRGLVMGAIIALIAYPVAVYTDETRLVSVFLVLSGVVIVAGLPSAYLYRLQKEMNFRLEFIYRLTIAVTSFAAAVGLALWLRNYWALVLTQCVSASLGVVLSYCLFPIRHRLTFRFLKDVFNFSKWIIWHESFSYLTRRVDILILGGTSQSGDVGRYDLGFQIGTMPTMLIAMPLARSLFPGLVSLRGSPNEFQKLFLTTVAGAYFVGMPIGVGIALVASPMIRVLLEPQWHPLIPLLQPLALVGVVRIIQGPAVSAFLALGRTRDLAALGLVQLAVKVAVLLSGFYLNGIVGLAQAVLLASFLHVGLFCWALRSLGVFSLRIFSGHVWRFVVSSGVMSLVVLAVPEIQWDGVSYSIFTLIAKVASGVVTYTCCGWMLWRVSGRTDGLENRAFTMLESTVARMLGSR